MVRAHSTQIVIIWRELFVHEPVIAGDINASISLEGRIEFVVVEQGIALICTQKREPLADFFLQLIGKFFVLTLEHPVFRKAHALLIEVGHQLFKTVECLYILTRFEIFFALYE